MPDVIMPSVPVPVRLMSRPKDHRGFIVPYFVAWLHDNGTPTSEPYGKPDFRVVDSTRMRHCVNQKLCWLCGHKLGVHMAFVIGPMCCINKIISEPPSHLECATYALKVCPFLTKPRMRRNTKDLPEGHVEAAGYPAERNPGMSALWITRSYQPFRPHAGHFGTLFRLGPFERVQWWKEGRPATRIEAVNALDEGYEFLLKTAEQEGPDAVELLKRMAADAERTLP